jgi:hypothetical protein
LQHGGYFEKPIAQNGEPETVTIDKRPLSNLEWVDYRVKCGRKPGEANT